MGDDLSCRQAQCGVNFNLEGQGQSPPKTIGILTKVFYTYGPNLLILAWTGDELSLGQARDYHTHGQTNGRAYRQMQATTINGGQNWPWVKRGFSLYAGLPHLAPKCGSSNFLKHTHYTSLLIRKWVLKSFLVLVKHGRTQKNSHRTNYIAETLKWQCPFCWNENYLLLLNNRALQQRDNQLLWCHKNHVHIQRKQADIPTKLRWVTPWKHNHGTTIII